MKARNLIAGAAYGPETLKLISTAFDEAWAQIQHHFYDDPVATEAGRLQLANAILAIAKEESRDAEELKNLALQTMAMTAKRRDNSQ